LRASKISFEQNFQKKLGNYLGTSWEKDLFNDGRANFMFLC
jgi:hypothetical protein